MDKNKPGVMLRLSKNDMVFQLLRLLADGAITEQDLDVFSDDLRAHIALVREQII